MTQREIIKTLLAKDIPERVGLNEHFWPHIVENSWGEQGVEPGTDFVERFNLDLRSVSWFSSPAPRPDLACVVEESDEWIVMHTCGDFRPHIDSIIEAGVDCIQAMEAKTGMDVVNLAEQYKDKLCFMGNIDIRALESGDRDRIKTECLGKLNGMKALRAPYVFMSDHSIPPSVSVENYEYMLELFHTNSAYS